MGRQTYNVGDFVLIAGHDDDDDNECDVARIEKLYEEGKTIFSVLARVFSLTEKIL